MTRKLTLEVESWTEKHAEPRLVDGASSPQSVLADPYAHAQSTKDSIATIGLRLDCAASYVNETHESLLRELWDLAFPGTPFARASSRWEELGFQTEDPERDLRGAGVIGLKQLIHFCRSSGNLAVVRRGQTAFPLASASLNVTLVLCAHLWLLAAPAGGACAISQCSEEVKRCFERLHVSSVSSISDASDPESGQMLTSSGSACADLMHEQCLRWLFERWEGIDATLPLGYRLMQMPQLLRELREHLSRTLGRMPSPWSLQSVLVALRAGGVAEFDECNRNSFEMPTAARVINTLLVSICPPSRRVSLTEREHVL